MHGVTVQELRVFSIVGQLLSFTQAAARLGISQPALSMSVRQLEMKLGTALFERSTRAVHLSVAGQALLPLAERVVENFDRTVSTMIEVGAGRQGRVTVACPEGVAAQIVAPTIKDFVDANPGIVVSVFDGDAASVEHMMLAFAADFGITGYWRDHPDFLFEPLTADECCVICPPDHPFAERRSIALPELHNLPIAALNRDAGTRRLLEAQCAALGVRLNVRFEVARVSTLVEMVASGLCVSVLTRLATPYQTGAVAVVPLEGPGFRYTIGVITPAKKSLTPSAERLLRALKSRIGPLEERPPLRAVAW